MEKKPYSALQQQSLDETTFYMTSAINIINKKLGESYAEKAVRRQKTSWRAS